MQINITPDFMLKTDSANLNYTISKLNKSRKEGAEAKYTDYAHFQTLLDVLNELCVIVKSKQVKKQLESLMQETFNMMVTLKEAAKNHGNGTFYAGDYRLMPNGELKKLRVVEEGENAGSEEWSKVGWMTSSGHAAKVIFEKMIRASEVEDLNGLEKCISQVGDEIMKGLGYFGSFEKESCEVQAEETQLTLF